MRAVLGFGLLWACVAKTRRDSVLEFGLELQDKAEELPGVRLIACLPKVSRPLATLLT